MQALGQWVRDEKRMTWIFYSVLSLVILLPLLLPGYILTLDPVFTPHFPWPTELTNTYPVEALLWLLHFVLPGDVIEKIILLFILLLSGVGMHQLVQRLQPKGFTLSTWRIAAYVAGSFYMINPFTYSRFMAGQWLVLAGYALLPFFVGALVKLAARPTWRAGVQVALWGFVIVSFSLHHLGMLVLLGATTALLGIVKWRKDGVMIERLMGSLVLSVLVGGMLACFWLVPALLGKGNIGGAVSDFNATDFTAFATTATGPLGAVGEVIRLQGFWPEARHLYLLPQAVVPLWGLLFLFVWVIVIIGGIKLWRSSRLIALLMIVSILAGIVLSATSVLAWLGQMLPLLSGYREPHKFVNLIAIGYAVLGGVGVAYVVKWVRERFHKIGARVTIIISLLLPIMLTPVMLWGFAGQLSPRQYPGEWYQMNELLKRTVSRGEVLFLPWHQYMRYDFSDRIIASPAEKFFEVPVIASDDPEFKGVSPTVPDTKKRRIAEALKDRENFVRVLEEQDISYIVLVKEDDYQKYAYLNTLSGIRLIQEGRELNLYQVKGEAK